MGYVNINLLNRYASTAYDRGLRVIIAGAGGAAHLPGMVAAFAPGVPVIGVRAKLMFHSPQN